MINPEGLSYSLLEFIIHLAFSPALAGLIFGLFMKERGFTLIEVVVALAILGIGLTVIIELFSGGLRLGRVSGEYTRAVNYASMKMEEIAVKPTLEEGSEEGEFADLYRWQIEVKKLDILPLENNREFKPPAELYHIQVNIIWKSGSRERSTGLESYRTIKLEDQEKKS